MSSGSAAPDMASPVPAAEVLAEIHAFEEAVAERQADLERGIERAGLQRDPYRHVMEAQRDTLGLYPMLVRLLARPPSPISDAQWEATRAELRALALPINRVRVAIYLGGAAALLCTGLGLGYWMGRASPVTTPFGEWPAGLVEAVRATDMPASWELCQNQVPRQGREWCKLPLWKRPATPPG